MSSLFWLSPRRVGAGGTTLLGVELDQTTIVYVDNMHLFFIVSFLFRQVQNK